MDEKEKINDSYLTIEAKTDINRMLGNEGSGGGSSFNTQLETSEGLTLGKDTENEVSLTANELTEIKAGGSNLFVIAKGSGEVGRTPRALVKGDAIDVAKVLKINNLTPLKKYAFVNAISVNSETSFRFIETSPMYPSLDYVYEADENGEISITMLFQAIALDSLSQYTVIGGLYYITLLEITDSVSSNISIVNQ